MTTAITLSASGSEENRLNREKLGLIPKAAGLLRRLAMALAFFTVAVSFVPERELAVEARKEPDTVEARYSTEPLRGKEIPCGPAPIPPAVQREKRAAPPDVAVEIQKRAPGPVAPERQFMRGMPAPQIRRSPRQARMVLPL